MRVLEREHQKLRVTPTRAPLLRPDEPKWKSEHHRGPPRNTKRALGGQPYRLDPMLRVQAPGLPVKCQVFDVLTLFSGSRLHSWCPPQGCRSREPASRSPEPAKLPAPNVAGAGNFGRTGSNRETPF